MLWERGWARKIRNHGRMECARGRYCHGKCYRHARFGSAAAQEAISKLLGNLTFSRHIYGVGRMNPAIYCCMQSIGYV